MRTSTMFPSGWFDWSERYILIKMLGGGATATVYLAKDTQLDEFIALKVLPPMLITDNTAVERMREEVRIAKQLRHNNIVTVYDLQIDHSRKSCFITMEYVDGEDLSILIGRKGKLPMEEVLPIVEQVASALDYAHSRGVIHRDIKPKNIMIAKDGTVKVTDFGIAKRLKDEMSRVSQTQVEGTPAYMAPEHLLGERIDRKIDIYSLAATVYELLCGHPPYQGSYEQIIAQVVRKKKKKIEPIKGVPDYLSKALLRALSHNPTNRPTSALEFYDSLLKPAEIHPHSGGLVVSNMERVDQRLAVIPKLLKERGIALHQRRGYKAGKVDNRNWCQFNDGDIQLNIQFPNKEGKKKRWKLFARFSHHEPPGELWDRPEEYQREKAQWMPAGKDVWGIAYEDILDSIERKTHTWESIIDLIVSDLQKSLQYFRRRR